MDLISLHNGFISLGQEIKGSDGEGVYEVYYKAKSDYEQLKEQLKTTLAVYELKHADKKTQTEIARHALADKEYKDFVKAVAEAGRKMNQAFAKVKSCEARLSIYQSLNKHLALTETSP